MPAHLVLRGREVPDLVRDADGGYKVPALEWGPEPWRKGGPFGPLLQDHRREIVVVAFKKVAVDSVKAKVGIFKQHAHSWLLNAGPATSKNSVRVCVMASPGGRGTHHLRTPVKQVLAVLPGENGGSCSSRAVCPRPNHGCG